MTDDMDSRYVELRSVSMLLWSLLTRLQIPGLPVIIMHATPSVSRQGDFVPLRGFALDSTLTAWPWVRKRAGLCILSCI